MMKTLWTVAVLSLLWLAAVPPKLLDAQTPPTLAVIVGANNRTTEMSLATLKRVFTGYDVGDGSGGRFIPFNHPAQSPTRTLFDRAVLGMTADQTGRYWVEQMIRGQARAPRTVPTAELLIRVVAQVPGAISYVDAKKVDLTVHALRIDGFDVNHPKYPLR